jgi:putative flippase GtrA
VVANTALNRRATFGLRGRGGRNRAWLRSLSLHAGALVVTTFALVLVHSIAGAPTVLQETVALVLAGGIATAARVLLLPTWVFRSDPAR